MSELFDNSESEDPSYSPHLDHLSQNSECESDIPYNDDKIAVHNLSTVSVTSTGQSCIKTILQNLKTIQNKHNWNLETLDTLLQKYFQSKKGISKLFMYEMDVLNREVRNFFGKNLFKKTDSKNVRVNKIFAKLKSIPQLLVYESSDEENVVLFQPKKLFKIYKIYLTASKYPKEFLASQVCKINHLKSVSEWESQSLVPIIIELPWINTQHLIFNYPDYNSERRQIEMRTFDYTRILNNFHFHICHKGLTNVRTEALLDVSEEDHDILPRAIVEDKMDWQNSTTSQRFFSKDVQKILTKLGHNSEAQFVYHICNWFHACDERGMDVRIRLWHLNNTYEYLLQHLTLDNYPPLMSHIGGIAIKTYEAILHSISSRFSLFKLSLTESYNSRSISTLAVESFFSDLSRFEFGGLSAPKAVDITKLISHVVHINTTKHDPK